ncbi:hypothetical protein U1Q18_004454 [Sarracenia purpurea var. burkii]
MDLVVNNLRTLRLQKENELNRGEEASRVLSGIENLKSAKSEIDHRRLVLEAQLCDTNPSSPSCSLLQTQTHFPFISTLASPMPTDLEP